MTIEAKGSNGASHISERRGVNTDLVPPAGSHMKRDVIGTFSSQTPNGRRNFALLEDGTARPVTQQAIDVMRPPSVADHGTIGVRLPRSSRRNGFGR